MSKLWVENVGFTNQEASEIEVVLRRHLRELEEVLLMDCLVPFTRQCLEDEVVCIKSVLNKIKAEV